jgi:hypothetical protein
VPSSDRVETSSTDVETSGPSLRLVFGILGVIVVVAGFGAFWRYKVSERHFAATVEEMNRLGPTLDTEGCVDAVLAWHRRCEANRPLCDNGVPMVMTHCLAGRDRSESCAALDLSSSKAQWVWKRCLDRGDSCVDKKRCACADAYRALDSYCRHEQRGVAL